MAHAKWCYEIELDVPPEYRNLLALMEGMDIQAEIDVSKGVVVVTASMGMDA